MEDKYMEDMFGDTLKNRVVQRSVDDIKDKILRLMINMMNITKEDMDITDADIPKSISQDLVAKGIVHLVSAHVGQDRLMGGALVNWIDGDTIRLYSKEYDGVRVIAELKV